MGPKSMIRSLLPQSCRGMAMEVSAAPYKAARSWQMESAPTPADLPSKINSPPRAGGMAEQHRFNNVRL